ncbi:hypothetical protein [Enterobacter ludwigii]|jgi:hypothetical protein|uniref:hypothetical protein n=1 Tax=Enterobacter ludwigii TaxID=299767 RepID=UPI002788899B|nr:hypothetical protein [Enterobacter ludwigii]MDP9943864.1 hypothetical protein [Enterobacter ludwigii]
MLLQKIRQSYYDSSGALSSITRQSCLGGIALIWLFKGSISESPLKNSTELILIFPNGLYWSLFFLILSLISDFMQYFCATIIWGIYGHITEKRLNKRNLDKETHVNKEPSDWINAPALLFFYGKIIFSFIGFWKLTQFMLTITIGY